MKSVLGRIPFFLIILAEICIHQFLAQVTLISPPTERVTRAGHNVTLACEATNGTYVLLLEWQCLECEVPGNPEKTETKPEIRLVEYTPESTTLFHHEGRMTFQPPNFDLTFRPVRALDSGQYDCIVNNQRKTIINLLVQDVPDPPGRPLIMGFSSRKVNLSWTPSQDTHHSPISHYIVHVRQGEGGRWDVENGRATRSNATQVTVTDLAPFMVYSFRVVAVNGIGESHPSKESYYMVTLRELPEGKPIFTAAHNSSATSIQLFWKPPPSSTIHGEFLGYKITLRPRHDDPIPQEDKIDVTIRDSDVNTFVVKNLKPYTQYLVSLQVFNPEGSGPPSTVAVMTDEGVPGPPENLSVVSVSDSSVDLSWSRPRNPNGEVRGYRIYYMRGNFTSVRTDHGDLPLTRFTLNNLEPNSIFKIWTKAFTSRHEGESSYPVLIETDVSSPGAPIIENLTCQSDTTLFLHWRRPALYYGAVHLYYIYYRAEDSYQFEEIVVNSINNKENHNFLITNLSVNTMYELKVRAGTYSRFYADNNLTYKGPFSQSRKILLFPDCHRAPVFEHRSSGFEMSAGIVAGIICAGFALSLLVIAMLIYRYFQGAYYYLDDPPKVPPVLMHDWENDTGGDGSFGSIDVHDFAKHVQELHADGDIGFSKEYEAIQAASAQEQHSAEHSHHPENKQKNRYLNIVAYDHSRVPLRPLPGQKKAIEYVNANYIDGYDKPRAYIGTQGPLPSTFDTFWRMVWEQRVHIIVMITNLVERGRKKCDQYWPKEGSENYGFIQVTLLHEEVLATYTIRKLAIRHLKVKCKKSGGGERVIYQYHYTNWPDHGTPDHPLPVLSFVRKSAAANPEDAGPIIVHCSAGVGRTGTYIVLDAMLQQIRLKGRLNIWGFLKHIRTQRNFLVQTEEQYIFIHDALLEAIQSGDTCIPTAGLSRYIKMLLASDGPPDKQPQPSFYLQHQHKLVTNFQPRDFNVVSAVKPVNREKNRSLDHLPMENGRVHLTPKPGVDGSDYINGTWLMGHQRLREFILTQHPLPNTILDFWQMIWDHNAQTVVVLTNIEEEKGFPQFWPADDDDFDTEHWKVRYLEEKLHSGLATVEVAVQSTQDDYELPVRLIHAPDWPYSLPSLATTLSLVSLVQEMTTNYQNGPLVVVDRYGGTEGAVFCILSTLKNQVEFEQHLDPYMYFKLYHNRRPAFWQTQDDLLSVYNAMDNYLSNTSNGSDSSSDLAGFSDPVISMPPVTTFLPPPPTPISILHQLVQETQKQDDVSSISLPEAKPVLSPSQAPPPPQNPSLSTTTTPTAPQIWEVFPQEQIPGQVTSLAPPPPSGSQLVSPGPANGYATLTGNGNLRVPPEGMEDAPLAADVPPV